MDSATVSRNSFLRPGFFFGAGLLVIGLAFSYVWIVPLFRPRGELLGGYYSVKHIYLGIPVALAAVVALVLLLTPSRFRRAVSLRIVPVSFALLAVIFVSDAVYAIGLNGAWWSDFWLDQAHLSRKHSVPDSELGFARKPWISWRGFAPDVNRIVIYRSDENGFRNPPGIQTADIVFVGDSYTEAATVEEEDTFVRKVGRETGLSVVNLGRGAYGPQQELIVLRRYGLAYKPKAIVWQLFEGNDLKDAEIFARWKSNPHVRTTSFRQRYLANSLIKELTLRGPEVKWSRPKAHLRDHDGSLKPTEVRYGFDPTEPARIPVAIEETKRAIEEGHRLCEDQGIKLIVVMIPTMLRVVEPYMVFDRVQDRDRFLPHQGSADRGFSGELADFCRDLGCKYIDTFDKFRQLTDAGERSMYIPIDEHLDIRGHEVVTEMILQWLRDESIIDQV